MTKTPWLQLFERRRNGGHVGLWLFPLVTTGAFVSLGSQANSQPVVQVQARTLVHLEATVAAPQGETVLYVRLHDDGGRPLSGRPLALLATHPGGPSITQRLRTDSQGSARWRPPQAAHAVQVRVRFAGERHYAGSSAHTELLPIPTDAITFWPSDGTLSLDTAQQTVRIGVRGPMAASSSVASGTLTLPHASRPVHGRELADGTLAFELDTALLQPGPQPLRVRLRDRAGSPLAEATREYHGQLQPALDLAVTRQTHNQVVAEGHLRSRRGPLPDQEIRLQVGRTALRVRTDETGHFALPLPSTLAPAPVQAYFSASIAGYRDASSASVPWPSEPLAAFQWLGILWCLGAVPWGALWWMRRRAQRRSENTSSLSFPPPSDSGDQRAVPQTSCIQGWVMDLTQQAPIANAGLEIRAPDGMICWSGRSTRQGAFESSYLAAGAYTLRAGAAGYTPVELTVHSPHQGQWTDVVLHLPSLRAAIADSFERATRTLPMSGYAGALPTPREVARWGTTTRNFTLSELALAVDRALFGQAAPSPDTASRLQTALYRLAAEASDHEISKSHPPGR